MSILSVGSILIPTSKIQADQFSPNSEIHLGIDAVVGQTVDGQIIELGSHQYLVLEEGVVLILDQLAQSSSRMPTVTSGQIANIISGTPVQSGSGDVVQTTYSEPLWFGERGVVQALNLLIAHVQWIFRDIDKLMPLQYLAHEQHPLASFPKRLTFESPQS